MSKVRLFHELTDDVFVITKKTLKDNIIKFGKGKLIKVTKLNEQNEEIKIRAKLFKEKSFIGKILPLPFWSYIPIYRTSYNSGEALEFGKNTKSIMDPKTLQRMSEEDTTNELLAVKAKTTEMLVYMALGGFAGAFLVYFFTSGGLSAVTG